MQEYCLYVYKTQCIDTRLNGTVNLFPNTRDNCKNKNLFE